LLSFLVRFSVQTAILAGDSLGAAAQVLSPHLVILAMERLQAMDGPLREMMSDLCMFGSRCSGRDGTAPRKNRGLGTFLGSTSLLIFASRARITAGAGRGDLSPFA